MAVIVKMSVNEYVDYRKAAGNAITTQAVTKAIRMRHRTPGIVYTEMYGGTYILHVNIEELDNYLVVIKKPFKLHTTKQSSGGQKTYKRRAS